MSEKWIKYWGQKDFEEEIEEVLAVDLFETGEIYENTTALSERAPRLLSAEFFSA